MERNTAVARAPLTLLTLPPELLDRIIALVLQPTDHAEFGAGWDDAWVASGHPRDALMSRTRSLIACKQLLKLALPAYFRHTQPNVVVGNTLSGFSQLDATGGWTQSFNTGPLFGTFEPHALFFHNTLKLRVEIIEGHFEERVMTYALDVIRRCRKLAHLRVCVDSIEEKDGVVFYERVKQVVEEMMKSSEQHTSIRKETNAEYESKIEIREAVEKKRVDEAKKRGVENKRRVAEEMKRQGQAKKKAGR